MAKQLTQILKGGLLASVLFLSIGEASAIDIIVKTTAAETKLGFTAGQEVTVTYTINPNFAAIQSSSFNDPSYVSWGSGWGDTPIFSNIAITGVTGAYNPVLGGEPAVSLSLSETGNVSFYVWQETLGYQAGGENVWSVDGNATLSLGGIFSLPSSYVDPTAYFSNYLGTYAVSDSYYTLSTGDSSSGVGPNTDFINLNVSQVLIVNPVPEPGSVALLSIGAVGALWMARRRRAA